MPGFGREFGGRGGGFGGGGGFGRGAGFGPDGSCVCENCGHEVPHQRGVPCYTLRCPVCGGPMIRKVAGYGGTYRNSPTANRPVTEEKKDSNVKYTKPHKPKVDESACIGCGNCVRICPFNAIELKDGVAYIDSNKCRDCGRCIDICPVGAIS
ncbi:4Fe-4S dicluster domain-containing protein [Thermoanaerobacter uzonensis DSM 18761]|uniref:Ferredoxin n=1 Tax=Thermoanaerobacter uzonensis DSM 18761 TaxID=1123369 RepID=A0A1M4ZME7_9THEO|nr:4Fe-4S binding protein [Thermoanaerobacter uzonensis]SHF19280.1 4Fe-4S dicluster domain-containing protein [Thermoanaerobacter uzonensis DSM 18761]